MEIKNIIEQNPWWENKEKINEDEKVRVAITKKRKIKYSFDEDNYLIIGPRQVGKTTFLKLFIKNLIDKGENPRRILYFSCEILNNFNEILEILRFSDSLIEGRKYIFFDEITFVPEWQRAIKFLLDSPLIQNKVILLTGSSSVALKKETFPGRPIKTKIFYPLSFKEFCKVFGNEDLKREVDNISISSLSLEEVDKNVKKLLFYFNEIENLFNLYIQCGGFPKSMYELLENGKIREETYEIYWKWLIADIAKIDRSERITTSVLLGVLKNYGTRFSLNSIAKEMEIGSHVTVREYLEILENLFVLRNLFPIDIKKGAEAFRRMRKVYFIDPFLFHVFKRHVLGAKVKNEDYPKIIEGIVAEHLVRRFGKIYYFHQKKEVDFYLHNTGIEVKWQDKVDKKDFPRVEIKNKILLSKSEYEVYENMIIVPVSLVLLVI